MRTIRKVLDVGLPLVGIVAILGAVVFITSLRTQLAVVIGGILLIEVGIWRLVDPLLPNERRYHALRAEVDRFIGMARDLNRLAVDLKNGESRGAHREIEAVRTAMHESVDRMAGVAGKTDFEVAVQDKEGIPS